MKDPLFIDKNVNILTGKEAEDALNRENDQKYITKESGIVCVTQERWNNAQEAELNHWMVKGIKAKNDRNDKHYFGFDGYRVLRGKTFNTAIELGCGPFTNMRFIGFVCNINKCALLDPLADKYLNHAYCSYNDKYLFLQDFFGHSLRSNVFNRLKNKFPGIMKKFDFGKKISLSNLITEPIENMPTGQIYDLVVIINVIEHCFDINKVFDKILSITTDGGYFVFHDKFYEHESVVETIKTRYDTAHPLKVDKNVLNSFFEQYFEELYKCVKREHFLNLLNKKDVLDTLYYIGKRK